MSLDPLTLPIPERLSTVADIRSIERAGPWPSKSGGQLTVPWSLPGEDATAFLALDRTAADSDSIGHDLRGLRLFLLDGIPRHGRGGGEFHRLRAELLVCFRGRFEWIFEDLLGGRIEITAGDEEAFWVPPFVLHTYRSLEADSALIVLANTTFDPSDPSTQDSFNEGQFRSMQQRVQSQPRASR